MGPRVRILMWIWEGFGIVLGAPGAPFASSEANLDTCTSKQKGPSSSASSFGHEKWSRELLRSRPEDPKIDRSNPEERSKKRCEQKSVKTSKTSTLSTKCMVLVAGKNRKFSKIGPEVASKACKVHFYTNTIKVR